MSSYITMIGFMSCLFAVATLLQNIRYSLVDDNRNPALQSILQIICLILWALSLPVTVVAYFLWLPKHNRQEALHKKELAAKALEDFEILDRKIAPVEKELNQYRELASSERKAGYSAGIKQGYKSGYFAGHRDGVTFTLSILPCPDEQKSDLYSAAIKNCTEHLDDSNLPSYVK